MTQVFLFQSEPISASTSLTLQTVDHVINLVANVSAPRQIPGTIEAVAAQTYNWMRKEPETTTGGH